MTYEEALRLIFPLLKGEDLATCMQVCKQWRDIAGDDYFWKCLCAKRWPSICKRSTPSPVSYRELFQMFCKRRFSFLRRPEFSFNNFEFYIDIWNDGRLVLSEVVSGSLLPGSIEDLPLEVCEFCRFDLLSPAYKMVIPFEGMFSIERGTVSLSILVCRRDTNQLACICEKVILKYPYCGSCRHPLDLASNIRGAYFVSQMLAFSEICPFAHLLYVEVVDDFFVCNVFGIGLEFGNYVRDEFDLLSILYMLNWD